MLCRVSPEQKVLLVETASSEKRYGSELDAFVLEVFYVLLPAHLWNVFPGSQGGSRSGRADRGHRVSGNRGSGGSDGQSWSTRQERECRR